VAGAEVTATAGELVVVAAAPCAVLPPPLLQPTSATMGQIPASAHQATLNVPSRAAEATRRRRHASGRGRVAARASLLATLVFAAAGCAGSSGTAQTARAPGANTLRGIAYCAPGGKPQTLDLYEPAGPGAHPVAVYIHGGGWRTGSSALHGLFAALARDLTARGVAVASINYRLSARQRWPAPIVDSKCSIRFLRAHAAQYRLDPARIAAYGDSAGGHLASLVGLLPKYSRFDRGAWGDQSSAVSAVADLYGPTDLATMTPTTRGARKAVLQEFGEPVGTRGPVLTGASPVSYVSAKAPPFLIVHGTADSLVPISQSTGLASRLRAAGVPVQLMIVAGAGHGLIRAGGAELVPPLARVRSTIVGFLAGRLAVR
jgi:acetyl esterase/lipase